MTMKIHKKLSSHHPLFNPPKPIPVKRSAELPKPLTETRKPPTTPMGSIPDRIARKETPLAISRLGSQAEKTFWTFFEQEIAKENTRQAYLIASFRFLDWALEEGSLDSLTEADIQGYLGFHQGSPSTQKQHLAAIRKMLEYMTVKGVLEHNPAKGVKGPRIGSAPNRTPLLSAEQARLLLDSIDTSHLIGLRDRALIGILLFTFARVSAAVELRVQDYEVIDDIAYLSLRDREGKINRVPLHPNARAYLETYLEQACIDNEPPSPLFRSSNRSRNRNQILNQPMTRKSILKMLKRRVQENGLPESICAQSFRGTGIVAYLRGGGDIEIAARIAGHESIRSTQAYLREDVEISLNEIQRIEI